jgi:peptidoglycan/LPS O-acetylase OafA/YrhL
MTQAILRAPAAPDRIAALDGVRGLAILLVVLFHALFFDVAAIGAERLSLGSVYVRVVSLGWCGVDVFFVLSGFLITGILLRSKTAPHYFRDFYARRALRIFPLYYVVVALLLFVLDRPATTAAEKASYLFYYQNVRYALWGEQTADHARLITWSLAIEEQFYLVWPAVVWLASRRALVCIAATAIAAAIALRFVLTAGGLATTHFLTPCRVDTLMAGALIAVLGVPPRWLGVVATLAGGGALLAIAASTGQPWPQAPDMQRWGLLAALAFAVGLLTLVRCGGVCERVCAWHPLRSLGRYSYCVYLVHYLVIDAVTRLVLAASPEAKQWLAAWPPLALMLAFAALCLLASWAIGWLSWHLFERHFLALKRHFPGIAAKA